MEQLLTDKTAGASVRQADIFHQEESRVHRGSLEFTDEVDDVLVV